MVYKLLTKDVGPPQLLQEGREWPLDMITYLEDAQSWFPNNQFWKLFNKTALKQNIKQAN